MFLFYSLQAEIACVEPLTSKNHLFCMKTFCIYLYTVYISYVCICIGSLLILNVLIFILLSQMYIINVFMLKG